MSLFDFVKSKLSILDVLSEYVLLKQAGNYWKGPCPLHHEKEASFTVSPDRQIFYCFGCHAGGDLIAFVAKKENLSQIEATKYLIEKYQIEIPEHIKEFSFKKKTSKSFFDLYALVSDWMYNRLLKDHNSKDYLQKRNIGSDLIKYFKIGYFPGGLKNINLFLRDMASKNFLAKDLTEAGVLVEGRSVLYSPFEERIVFPIKDSIGRVCGFGGRIFRPGDSRAKYYNSKESLWFSKGKLLFGMDLAKAEIQKRGEIFLVEGYTDCVAMVQNGYPNTVATLGTACTQHHLKIISRYANTVYILYDGDQAGQKAVLRLTQLCWGMNLDLKIIKLSPEEDPESFLNSKKSLKQKIDNAEDIFSFFINKVGVEFDHKPLADKMRVGESILKVVGSVENPLKREILFQQASKVMQIPVSVMKSLVLEQKMENWCSDDLGDNTRIEASQNENRSKKRLGKEEGFPLLEERIFSAIVNSMDGSGEKLFIEVDLRPYFSTRIQSLMNVLDECLSGSNDTSGGFNLFLSRLSEEDKNWVIGCSLRFNQIIGKEVFNELVIHFCKKHWKRIVIDLKSKLLEAKENNNIERQNNLFNMFVRLKKGIMSRGLI